MSQTQTVPAPACQTLRFVITHKRPHLDELVACLLVQNFGKRSWNVSKDLEFRFMDEKAAAAFMVGRTDTIAIGILGGEFDEHKSGGRLPNTCATELVARHLGIHKWPELKLILREVRRADTELVPDPFSLSRLVKVLHAHGDLEPRAVMGIVDAFVKAIFRQSREFNRECPEVFETAGRVVEIVGFRVALIETNLESMAPWLRSRGHEIVVIRGASGNTQIFCNQKVEDAVKAMPLIARAILRAEFEAAGNTEAIIEQAVLRFEDNLERGGHLPGAAACWYWDVQGSQILNGSMSHQDVEPTRLSLASVEIAIHNAFSA